MRLSTILSIAILSATTLVASDLQQIADNLQVKAPTASSKKLAIPRVKGAQIRLLAADYEQIIDSKGNISKPLTDTPVRVSFVLSKDGATAISRDYEITVPGRNKVGTNPKPQIIPELLSWSGGKGAFKLPKEIIVSCPDAFAAELVREMNALLPEEYTVKLGSPNKAHIGFGATKGKSDGSYKLNITKDRVTITAPGGTGRYWGSRTLLQMLVQNPAELPCGSAWDAPRYRVRGFMLDVARLPIPMDYIEDVVRLMAWYKMNDLHLHMNDNFIFHEHYVDAGEDPFRKSYAAFRLQSEMKGKDGTPLTAQDLFYTKRQFRRLVRFAAERGVNIVPEFDAPGHALSFTRVRPDLIYQGPMNHVKRRCEMLDAANPETLSYVCRVWDEYLQGKQPAFEDCPVVHVGADEFFGAAEDYRKFADGLLGHIQERGHTPRIWGSLRAKRGNTPVRANDVQMNLWSSDWASAWESVNQGYDVINTNDGALYIVPFAGYYRADRNQKRLYENWVPNRIANENLPAGHPQLLGGTFAIWNDEIDRLHRGYGAVDLWSTIHNMVDVLSQKMWGQPTPPRSYDEHKDLAAKLNKIPYCNPLHLNNEAFSITPVLTPMRLRKGNKGPEYHLTMELLMPREPIPGEEQVLLGSRQGQLLAAGKDGRITLRRSDTIEFAYNAKLPVGRKVKLELIGKMGRTELLIDGVSAGEPENVRFPLRKEGRMTTFILPLESLGSSFNGKIYRLDVK
ncbi:MAG: family 20 glycosylhydrolase [Akkermansia sp.]|nr:family 20 glycosylhydrolase [Akkermansia sp.]